MMATIANPDKKLLCRITTSVPGLPFRQGFDALIVCILAGESKDETK
jgi:hypothetical protein